MQPYEELARSNRPLPAEFTVFNDMSFRGFNVDHVVVGPSGVWAIETKSHNGVVDDMSFLDTPLHGLVCSFDLNPLPLPPLPKNREQNDSPPAEM